MASADQLGFSFRPAERRTWTVRDLVAAVRTHLEREYGDVWVEGEISNFRAHDSGHLYFTLKDRNAQIRVVMFRSAARLLRFRPGDGLQVVVRGRVTIYEDRGELQISAECVEPKGAGALQIAFEQLKATHQVTALGAPDPWLASCELFSTLAGLSSGEDAQAFVQIADAWVEREPGRYRFSDVPHVRALLNIARAHVQLSALCISQLLRALLVDQRMATTSKRPRVRSSSALSLSFKTTRTQSYCGLQTIPCRILRLRRCSTLWPADWDWSFNLRKARL